MRWRRRRRNALRQIELEKILLPDLTAAVGARHGHEFRGAFEADGNVSEPGKCPQVAARTAAEIQNPIRRLGFDMTQQRADVLAHIMIAGTVAKIAGVLVVVLQRQIDNLC